MSTAAASSKTQYLLQRNYKSSVQFFMSKSMSAAAMRNDSSLSKRIKQSSATDDKSHKQSAVDDKHKAAERGDRQKQRGGADWRAWFSSSEYDDAWSPYRPLRPSSSLQQSSSQAMMSSNNSITNSQNTVENIMTNYNDWERRRHGMNLPPLTLDILTNNTSNNPQLTKLHSRTQRLNTQTRFTIQLLNDLYLTGIRRQMDRPTMERCHRLIGRLVGLSPREGGVFDVIVDHDVVVGSNSDDHDGGDTKVRVQITGAAQRGNAILERMEWCSPAFLPQLRKWQRWQYNNNLHKGGGLEALFLAQEEDVSSLEANNNDAVGKLQSRSVDDYHASKVPKHLLETKQAIPTPTRAIYNMVLLLYGKEAGSRDVAEQAEDVVWSMIVRGLQLEEFNMTHSVDDTKRGAGNKDEEDDDTSVPIYPNTENWNCVLRCWSNCSDPNRAFFAYSFYKSWMEWNDKRGKVVDGKVAGCDIETFHLMLKSCLVDEFTVFNDDSSGVDTTTSGKKVMAQRAKEVGSRVAIGIWKDLRSWKDRSSENTLTSETYLHLLKALCQTSELSRGLVATVAAVFQSCRNDGMETKEITNLVRGVMTESQFQKLLRSEVKSAASVSK